MDSQPNPSQQPNAPGSKDSQPDELLSVLDRIESEMRRVLFGVVRFFRDRLWAILRDFAHKAVKYVQKFALIAVWAVCYLLIAFLPVRLFGVVGLLWTVVVLGATIWAYKYYRLPIRRAAGLATESAPPAPSPNAGAVSPEPIMEVKPPATAGSAGDTGPVDHAQPTLRLTSAVESERQTG